MHFEHCSRVVQSYACCYRLRTNYLQKTYQSQPVRYDNILWKNESILNFDSAGSSQLNGSGSSIGTCRG